MPGYVTCPVAGATLGVIAAHLMFGLAPLATSTHVRAAGAQLFSELVATFGLLGVIWGCARTRTAAAPFAVASYIVAAYWFTASTSFANPAVTLARALTDTFAGIRPQDVPGFVLVLLVGAAAATALCRWPWPGVAAYAESDAAAARRREVAS